MGLFNSIRLGSSAAGDYEVERSLKFNSSDSAYLEQTPSSAGNRKTNTLSAWVKRGKESISCIASCYSGNSDANNMSVLIRDDGEIRIVGYSNNFRITNRLLRDHSAWYHIVVAIDTTQASADDRVKVYVNGVQETSFSTSGSVSQNDDLGFAQAATTRIGSQSNTVSNQFDGYIAEVNFIDGQALTPSSFAETDAITGQWIPKKYVGSYGTTGYYLNFSDNSNTTAATLGKDSSGNGHNFTPNNFSVAAGVGNDSLTDTPTNNFCTFNPLKVNHSAPIVFKEGNLEHNGVSGNNHLRSSTTMQVTSGKWYVEFKFISGYETTNGTVSFGLTTDAGHRDSNNDSMQYQNDNNFVSIQYRNSGVLQSFLEASSQSSLSGLETFENDDVMGIALDLDNDKLFISKNGTWFSNGTGTQDPANGTNPVYSGGYLTSRKSDGFYFSVSGYSAQVVAADFGQHGYAYTPPTGFKKVCTANLPDPSIKLPTDHFNTILWTGNGTNGRTVTGVGFDPDLTWIKCRSDDVDHLVYDTVRGGNKVISSNSTAAESSSSQYGYLSAFASDGFTLTQGTNGTHPMGSVNHSSRTYVAWNWNAGGSTATNNDGSRTTQVRANTTAGFSIVTSTSGGNSSGTYDSFGHGLGVAPDIIIFKNRDISDNWSVYNSNFATAYNKILQFNTIAETTSSNHWGTANPTSTTFSLNQGAVFNGAGEDLVAYCFSEVAGYSKAGTYVGNGNANGSFVYTGFRPAFILFKNADATTNWELYDTTRPYGEYNPALRPLYANHSYVEETHATLPALDILSNGFKVRSTWDEFNMNNSSIIYFAIAESPFKYSRAR